MSNIQTDDSVLTMIDSHMADMSKRTLAQQDVVQDIALDIRGVAKRTGHTETTAFIDNALKTWPWASLVATTEVIDFLLDVRTHVNNN